MKKTFKQIREYVFTLDFELIMVCSSGGAFLCGDVTQFISSMSGLPLNSGIGSIVGFFLSGLFVSFNKRKNNVS